MASLKTIHDNYLYIKHENSRVEIIDMTKQTNKIFKTIYNKLPSENTHVFLKKEGTSVYYQPCQHNIYTSYIKDNNWILVS